MLLVVRVRADNEVAEPSTNHGCTSAILPDDHVGNHVRCLPVADCDASVVDHRVPGSVFRQNSDGIRPRGLESPGQRGVSNMMDGPMEDHLELLQTMSTDWGNWMQSVNAQEIVVEVEGVGTRAAVTSRVLRPRGVLRRAQWVENEMPVELVREAVRLRAFMAHPRGGTWTWAALSMKSSEGYKLVSDFDYDREPVLDPPYTAEDCAKELEVFPRDPEAIPDWMKIGAWVLPPWK